MLIVDSEGWQHFTFTELRCDPSEINTFVCILVG